LPEFRIGLLRVLVHFGYPVGWSNKFVLRKYDYRDSAQ